MRPTVRDVARLAEVSPKTVSNVVNGVVPVSRHTRLRVERAMQQLDYVPNLSARGLRNGRSGVIALALPTLASSYSAELAHHVVAAAARHGWSVQVEETGDSAEAEAELLSRARSHLVDGLVLNPVRLETSAVQRGVSLPPVVLIGEVDQPVADHVWVDNVAAAREVSELLLARGCRRIAVLGVMRSATSDVRVAGHTEALAGAHLGVRPELVLACSDWTASGGHATLSRWLAEHEPPDAVFAFTDSLAIGALHALHEHGLRVPEDVAVAGFDDIADAAHLSPPLTSVEFDRARLAELALALLADRVAQPLAPTRSEVVPHRLVERASTGGVRAR